jgi:hypothetical protein
MKILITENKFKNMVNKLIGYDLSNRIEMITTWYDLDSSEKYAVFDDNKQMFVYYLNHYGPMYRFFTEKGDYLVQNQKGQLWFIANTSDGYEMDYYDFLKILGIESLGISLRKIIDEFVEE